MGLEKPVISGKNGGNKVKHIQRGTVGNFDANKEKVISLSGFSNVDKMVAIINGESYANNSSTYSAIYLKSLTVDTLTLGCTQSEGMCSGSYQVIEFD